MNWVLLLIFCDYLDMNAILVMDSIIYVLVYSKNFYIKEYVIVRFIDLI